MPTVHLTEMQKRVLDVIKETKSTNRYNITEKTMLKRKTVNTILQSLVNKGLINRKWDFGFYIYSPTGTEYETTPAFYEDEEKLIRLLEEHKGLTRNRVSRKLGFDWKKTVRLLSKLEQKGLVGRIEYNGIKIYTLKGSSKQDVYR